MYITHDQLVNMAISLDAMEKSTPRWNLVHRFRLRCMLATVVGQINWIKQNTYTQNETKCTGCGQFHSDLGPDPRSN